MTTDELVDILSESGFTIEIRTGYPCEIPHWIETGIHSLDHSEIHLLKVTCEEYTVLDAVGSTLACVYARLHRMIPFIVEHCNEYTPSVAACALKAQRMIYEAEEDKSFSLD